MNSLDFVCEKLGVDRDLIWSRRRDEKLMRQRRTIIWFYRMQGFSVEHIGAKMNRNHTTILYQMDFLTDKEKQDATKILEEWLKTDHRPKYKFIKKIPDYLHSKTTYLEIEQ